MRASHHSPCITVSRPPIRFITDCSPPSLLRPGEPHGPNDERASEILDELVTSSAGVGVGRTQQHALSGA